jgi:uncharacterized protein YprB with RNaseH-like and TPR domain
MKDFSKLTRDQIIWLAKNKCSHHHSYLEHTGCYKGNFETTEKLAFLDIECSNLKADWGIVLTWCLKPAGKKAILTGCIKKSDIKRWGAEGKEDTRILKELVKALKGFDRCITHYGSRFDLGYIRARSVFCGIEFPTFGALYQTDTWMIMRKKFTVSRNTLENGSRFLAGGTNKTRLTLPVMHGALRGEQWALDEMLHHNKFDVIDTENLYNAINPYIKITKSSI